MSILNPNTFTVGSPNIIADIKVVCINCGHENHFHPEVLGYGVHGICSNCHEYSDVYIKDKIKITCKHCLIASYFDDSSYTNCPKCGKDYDEEIDKNRKCDLTLIQFTSPLRGAIGRTYL